MLLLLLRITLSLFLKQVAFAYVSIAPNRQISKYSYKDGRLVERTNRLYKAAALSVYESGKYFEEPLSFSPFDNITTTEASADYSSPPLPVEYYTGPSPPTILSLATTVLLDNNSIEMGLSNNYTTTAATTKLSVTTGRALILIAAAIYGTNFGLIKAMDTQMPLALSAVLRFSLAAIAVTIFTLAQEQQQQNHNKKYNHNSIADNTKDKVHSLISTKQDARDRLAATWRGAEVGLWYSLGYLCQAQGLQLVQASKAAFFSALAVLVVPILDQLFRNKPMRMTQIGATLCAVAGVALLEFSGGNTADNVINVQQNQHGWLQLFTLGDLYCLLQVLFFGTGYWRLEHGSKLYPNHANRNTAGQLVAVAVGAILYLFVSSFITGGGGNPNLPTLADVQTYLSNPFLLGAVCWTGLISTALAIYLETVALQAVSAAELTLLMTTVSLWGSAFAMVSLGEVLPPVAWIGGLLILGSCAVSTRSTTTTTKTASKFTKTATNSTLIVTSLPENKQKMSA